MDAPANGLSYTASPSGLSGVTSGNGNYNYQTGDTVTFSLDVGGSTPITIGSIQPVAPVGGGDALTFVLSLNNGQQVAQVLQALNHGSTSTLDVSGLTITPATVDNLNSYISSGGVALPTGQTDVQLLTSAQTDATLSGSAPTFTTPVTGTFTTTVQDNLQTTLTDLSSSASTSIALDTLLPGKITFHQGITSSGTDFGIDYFKTDGTVSAVSSDANNTINLGSPTYTANGNQLVITNGQITDTITISYIDAMQGLWTDSASDGSTGAGSYIFLQPLTIAAIKGKTATINGSLGECGDIPFQLVISADGTSFTSNCQGGAIGSRGHGTVAANTALPGTITFTDSDGVTLHHVGLVSGTVTSGSIAVVEPGGTENGISGITAQ